MYATLLGASRKEPNFVHNFSGPKVPKNYAQNWALFGELTRHAMCIAYPDEKRTAGYRFSLGHAINVAFLISSSKKVQFCAQNWTLFDPRQFDWEKICIFFVFASNSFVSIKKRKYSNFYFFVYVLWSQWFSDMDFFIKMYRDVFKVFKNLCHSTGREPKQSSKIETIFKNLAVCFLGCPG